MQNMNLGEKLETIVSCQSSGAYGLYLGLNEVGSHVASVDGHQYEVRYPDKVGDTFSAIVFSESHNSYVVFNNEYEMPMLQNETFVFNKNVEYKYEY